MIVYLGINDSITSCDCCGKSNLAKTVALEFDGEIRHYGTTCAGRAIGAKTRTVSDVQAAVSRSNKRERMFRQVDQMRAEGQNVVYGRFYISNQTNKTELTIKSPGSGLMVSQVYPR